MRAGHLPSLSRTRLIGHQRRRTTPHRAYFLNRVTKGVFYRIFSRLLNYVFKGCFSVHFYSDFLLIYSKAQQKTSIIANLL